MMGVYFAMTGLGEKLAGLLGQFASKVGEFNLFTGIAVFTVLFSILILVFLKKLNKLTHGAEDHETDLAH